MRQLRRLLHTQWINVGNRQLRAVLGKLQRKRSTNARTSARYRRYLILECLHDATCNAKKESEEWNRSYIVIRTRCERAHVLRLNRVQIVKNSSQAPVPNARCTLSRE